MSYMGLVDLVGKVDMGSCLVDLVGLHCSLADSLVGLDNLDCSQADQVGLVD